MYLQFQNYQMAITSANYDAFNAIPVLAYVRNYRP
jgi:hypothetical protein